jgi:eukaryotic-like serine/threonine-protein kinase
MQRDDVTASAPAAGAGPPGKPPIARDHPGEIGRYRVLGVLGEGGMGVVYLAEQTEPVRRPVALKILKLGMDTQQVIARFESERQSLAVMEHPGIARVFDAGATETGRPFFVMERVEGVPITEYCDRQRLRVRERVRLFAQVCRAVQHAHQKGVIHRDLKPSNVLVTLADDRPQCKIIDFGIARAVEQTLDEQTRLTQLDQSLGTPAYMSPEQVEAGQDIDTRSDIYSLGVLIYELLAGVLPFEPQAYRGWAFYAQHLVREPPVPSARFAGLEAERQAAIAVGRSAEPQLLRRQLRGDLDWIVMRALEKERERRYETANGFALDLERYLGNLPVVASPPSRSYAARKFARRHRVGVAFAAVLSVLLIGFAVAMTVQAERVARARDLAIVRQGQAEELIGFMVGDLRAKLTPVGRLDILDDVGQRALAYFAAVPEAELSNEELFRRAEAIRQLGEVRVEQGNTAAAMEAFREALVLTQRLAARDPRNTEWQVALGAAHFWVGYIHWLQSDLDGALAEFGPYRTIAERLVERDPGNPEWQRELSHAYSNLGSVQEARGDLEDALLSFRATLATQQEVARQRPGDRDTRFNLAIAHNKIAVILQKMGRFSEAAESFRNDLAIKDSLVRENSDDVPLREHLATAHAFVGRSLVDQGQVAEALPSFEAALELYRWLVERDPANEEWRTGLAHRLADLGYARGFLGSPAAAGAALEEAMAIFESLLVSDPSLSRWQRGLAASRHRIARVHLEHGRPAAALTELGISRGILEALVAETPADRLGRAALGEALLLEGDARQALGDQQGATAAWAEARRALEPLVSGSPEIEVQALWAAALMRTGAAADGLALASSIDERGYRHPSFVQLTHRLERTAEPAGH